VHGSQSSGTWSLLGLAGSAAVGALGTGQNTARSDHDDVTVGELLLELAGQALLDFVEAGEERDRDEDDDGALAMAGFDLWELLVQLIRVELCSEERQRSRTSRAETNCSGLRELLRSGTLVSSS